METTQIITYVIGIVIAIIGYFLKNVLEEVKTINKTTIKNEARIDLIQNNHQHLESKYDLIYSILKELIGEVKELTKEISKKKDI